MQAPTTPDRTLAEYEAMVDEDQWLQLLERAADLDNARIAHVNSTPSGGGVAEMLRSIVPLSNDLGIDTDWLVMEADEPFFRVTKRLHNGLQGRASELTNEMEAIYRETVERNAAAFPGPFDVVVLHDPQPLGMLETLSEASPDTRFVWRCHIDLTAADPAYRSFVADRARRADRVVFSHETYGEEIGAPSTVIHPSIDPLADKNRPLTDREVEDERDRLRDIPLEAPLVTQVSRYDSWKDPLGVVEAFRRLSADVPESQLVLVGGMADDDPEGAEVYERVAEETEGESDVHLLTNQPDSTVNFLQRHSDVVLQKSLREGFGLVVSEALWKRTPVVGSNVGGIPLQIDNGRNGYLVGPEDVPGVATYLVTLLEDEGQRTMFGANGREHVRERFVLPRQLADLLETCVTVLDRGC